MSHGERWRGLAVDIRRAAKPASREQLGLAAIEGLRLCERALRSGHHLREVLIAESLLAKPGQRAGRLLEELEENGTVLVPGPDALLLELCDGRDVGHLFGLVELPPRRSLGELVADAGTEAPSFLVLADVEEPGNVGALVRTALASGAQACVCVGRSDPWHPKALRTSMGSIFRIATPRIESTDELPAALRKAGIQSIGAVSDAGQAPWEIPRKGPVAFVVGSEAFGLSASLRDSLDALVTIPMPAAVDSYSVNAAAAVLLYEARRPRV